MNCRALILAAAVSLTASAAFASSKAKTEEAAPAGQYVELLPVALPIVANGQVVNYAFVYVRIDFKPGVDATKMRAREPYFRDALVRAAHRTPFTSSKDYVSVDEDKLKAAMFREATRIAGQGAVKAVVVLSQSPKRRTGLPKPNAG